MFRFTYHILISIALLTISGCGGGSSSAILNGILVDAFGAIVSFPEAVVSLQGVGEIAHPDSQGRFSLSAPQGTYILTGSLSMKEAGILIKGERQVTLTSGSPLDVGNFVLTDSNLDGGWIRYREGNYTNAEVFFLDYLDSVRSGQADIGSTSAYSALGWTRGHGLGDPARGILDFNKAIQGYDGNADAYAGLAACYIGLMRSDGGFHFNDAVDAVTKAIDIPGEYSSNPTHDDISEIDLMAFRALVNMLNGNTVGARLEAQAIGDKVATGANKASSGTVAIVLAFTN